MPTNPLGPEKVNLTVNMPRNMRAALERLAKRSNMRLGEYCRAVLEQALVEETEFERHLVKKQGIAHGYKVAEPPGPSPRTSGGDT